MLQTLAVGLLLIGAVLPDATADAGSQLRALKQFGGVISPPDDGFLMNYSEVLSKQLLHRHAGAGRAPIVPETESC